MRLAAFGQVRRSRRLATSWSDRGDLAIPAPFPPPRCRPCLVCTPSRPLITTLPSRSPTPARPPSAPVSTRSRNASISQSASSPAIPLPVELESLQLALSSCSTTNSRYFNNVPITTDLTPSELPPPLPRHSHSQPHTHKLTPSIPQPTPTSIDPLSTSSTFHPATVRPIMIHAIEVSTIAGYNRHIPIHHTFTAIWRRTEPDVYSALSRASVVVRSEEDEMADVLGGTSIPARMRELRTTIADITPKGIRAVYGELEERVEKEVIMQRMEHEQKKDEEGRPEESVAAASAAEQRSVDSNPEVVDADADGTEEVKEDLITEPRRSHASKTEAADRRRSALHSERQKHDDVRKKLKNHVRQEVRKMYGQEKEKAVIEAMKVNGQIVKQNNKKLHKKIMGTTTPSLHTHTLTLTATHHQQHTPTTSAAPAASAGAVGVPRVWMLGGRVDGFVNGELIEIKNRTTHLPHTLPNKDKCQFLVYLHILDLDSGRLVELIRGGRRYEQRKETVVVKEDESRLWSVCRWHLQRLVDYLCVFMGDEARQRAYVTASEEEQEEMLREVWPIGYVPRYRKMQQRQRMMTQQPARRVVAIVDRTRAAGSKRIVVERVSGAGKSRKKLSKSAKRNLGKAKARKLSGAKKATVSAATQTAAPIVLEQSV